MVPGPERRVFSYLLPLLLKHYPDIKLHLRTMTSPEQIQALQRREITAGFLRGPIDSDEIATEIYMRENIVAVLPEVHPLAEFDRIPVHLLADIPLIPISHDVAPAVHNVVGEVEAQTGVKFKIGFCTENLMTSMNAVASGLGFSFFASYVEEIVPKGVVTRPIDLDPAPTLDLLFAYRKDDKLPALERLVSLVRDHSPNRRSDTAE
jgi:LysR family hca operon transcriptional activator